MDSKYAEIVFALQDRIERGVLAVGALMPSEAELTAEFRTSRSTVVRALRHLRHQGWVRGVQGKGRIVLGRPMTTFAALPRRVQYLLQADRHGECLGSRLLPAVPRVAALLGLPAGATVFAARYRLTLIKARPLALTTAFTPVRLAHARGLLEQLESTHGRRTHRVVERFGARLTTVAETAALALPYPLSVALSILTVHDVAGTPFLLVDGILPRESPEMAETYEV
nr:GntR family transcriptional regulator [Dactylosporangium thailandense]